MGGYGSGQWDRWDKKDTVEAQTFLDVRKLHREGSLAPGRLLTYSWTRRGKPSGSIRVLTFEDQLILIYRSRPRGSEEWEDVRETVSLDWTASNYGGRRPWFLCPGRGCGRRVALLYGAGKYFLCRACHQLTYTSSQANRSDRALYRAQDFRRRLGGSGSMFEPFPDKPPRMHWKTYERLYEQGREADSESWGHLRTDLEKMDRRIDRLLERS